MVPCCNLRLIGLALLVAGALATLAAPAPAATAPLVTTLSSIQEGVRTPVRLALDPLGNIYVTDPRGGGVNRYNNAGKLLKSVRTGSLPLGIAVTAAGDLLVSQGSQVQVLDRDTGAVKASFGSFKKANGIAIDRTGTIYVADSLDSCVQVFNADYTPHATGNAATGKPVNSFGSAGQVDGQFLQPTGVSYERLSGRIAVVDTLAGKVQFFSGAGVWQQSVGSFGSGPLNFTSAQSAAFEYAPDGQSLLRMYVVDSFQGNVQMIDMSGATPAFLRYVGSWGMRSGNLALPSDLIFDASDSANTRLIIANGSGTLALFGISGGSPTPTSGPALTVDSYPLATNLTSLTLSGTSVRGATIKLNGTQLPVLTGTTWSGSVSLALGANVVSVSATNASGSTTRYLTINVIPQTGSGPAVQLSVDSLPSLTSAASIILKGVVTTGASVTVNGTAASVSASGVWSLTQPLLAGANNFLVVGSKSGMSDSTTSFNITQDTTPPQLKVFMLSNGSTTQTPVQPVSGTVTDASATSVTLEVNGVAQPAVPVSDGVFNLTATLALGSNTVALTASDAAGNLSPTERRTLRYDPTAPTLAVDIPSGAVVAPPAPGSAHQYSFSTTAPAGYNVTFTVNGGGTVFSAVELKSAGKSVSADPATLPDVTWAGNVDDLVPGLNQIEIKAVDVTDPTKSTTVAKPLIYSADLPQVSVTQPLADLTTANKSYTVVGKTSAGNAVSALVNGTPAPVSVDPSGLFALSVSFGAAGPYEISVSATDAGGNTSTCYRTLNYDPRVPSITVGSGGTSYSASNGILYAKDASGKFVAAPGSGTAALDLSAFTPGTLNVYALSPGGNSTRDGDFDRKGYVDIHDALKAIRFSLKAATPSEQELLYGEVATQNGKPVLNRQIGPDDVITILHKAIGFGQ